MLSKKTFFLIAGFVLISIPFSFIQASYSDVSTDYKYVNAIEFMTKEGVIQGNPDGTYQPERNLNRAELLKILIEARFETEFETYANSRCFPDVKKGEWFEKYVCFAKAKGIVKGYADGTFKPSREVNFVEAMKMTMKTYEYPYDENRDVWYEDLVQKAGERGFIPLDVNEFDENLNRGQMADMITRVVKEQRDELPLYISEQVQYFENTESPLLMKIENLAYRQAGQNSKTEKQNLPEGIIFETQKADEWMKSGELAFETSLKYPKCYGLVSHNNADERRINVVFIPAGYSSHQPVNEIVEALIDYNGTGNGMFSFEPYRSNKNKFNFWVSQDIFYEENHTDFLKNQRYDLNRQAATQLAKTNCPFERVVILSPIRYPNCTVAHSADQSIWMSIEEDGAHPYHANLIEDQDLQQVSLNTERMTYLDDTLLKLRHAPTFAHELGHIFGLADEYVNHDTFNTPLAAEIKTSGALNCYVGTQQQCETEAPWKAFMGQGEGFSKVGCYEGCQYHGKGIFRPTLRSLMNAPEGMYYPEPDISSGNYEYYEENVVYGPYNESIIKKAMDDMLK